MHLDRYIFVVEDNKYEFLSRGPRGNIKKVVLYDVISEEQPFLYNLSFGDWNEKQKRIDDLIVTNNGDAQKVLATVAATVLHFTTAFPQAFIFLMGSTASRTRLYQMGISAYLGLILANFEVEGFIRNKWESFQPRCNYRAFLLKPKKL